MLQDTALLTGATWQTNTESKGVSPLTGWEGSGDAPDSCFHVKGLLVLHGSLPRASGPCTEQQKMWSAEPCWWDASILCTETKPGLAPSASSTQFSCFFT